MKNDNDSRAAAIGPNFEALSALLRQCAIRASEAHAYADAGNRNAAIGTIIGLDEALQDGIALYRAILLLHRGRP